jgi:hypothetical protein
MSFKKFLVEDSNKKVDAQVDLIYQKVLDNLDESHIEASNERIAFNVGKIIKNSALNNLYFTIRGNSEENVRMGTDRQGRPTIVIDTREKIPHRRDAGKFLENPKISDKIKSQIRKWLDKHYDPESEVEPSTGYESKKKINSDFEDHYEELIKAVNKKVDDFHGAKSYLKTKHDSTGSTGRKEIITSAMTQLLRDQMGTSAKEFMGIVMKLPQASFIQHLSPDAKKIVMARLENYYEHKAEEFKK